MTVIPHDELAGARAATASLLAHLDAVDPDELRAPSRLPGWTRAHVVAHLAGNARSHVRMLDGCLAGQVRSQYEGGRAAREAAIGLLAADPVHELAAWLSGRGDGSGLQVLSDTLPVPPPWT
ncbi:MAG: maleylpyruvate isomerase family mycothiol-dependent enzyme [Frankiales bacterium]|nr:MAG: maleylpyruvate isomerase family mycothiol-dependent enzyme [Frankiales bacterium]